VSLRRTAAGVAVMIGALSAGCGGRMTGSAPRTAPRGTGLASEHPGAVAAADAVPSLDALAARGAIDAPLMREALRLPLAAQGAAQVSAERDTCVRAVFAASAPVKVSLVDASGTVRGTTTNGTAGLVPPNGPACIRRGEALRLVFEGPPPDATVRAVVFVAP